MHENLDEIKKSWEEYFKEETYGDKLENPDYDQEYENDDEEHDDYDDRLKLEEPLEGIKYLFKGRYFPWDKP